MEKRNQGMVLASNLIFLLLITLLATSMFKNALTQTQMINHYQLQLQSKQNAEQAFSDARALLVEKISNGDNLSVATKGLIPPDQVISINAINWNDERQYLTSANQSKYIMQYLGTANGNSPPFLGEQRHIFSVYINANSAKATHFVSQRLLTIKTIN